MRVRSLVGALTMGILALGACGDAEPAAEPAAPAAAHPFVVGTVPAEYELVVAGRGADGQRWDSEGGADEPYVVVDAAGRVVVATVAPWEPGEGSFKWASNSGDHEPETFTLEDGRPAAYGEGIDGHWDDLVIEVGRGRALRIATQDASREELVELARHLDSDGDETVPPTVEDRPEDWRVLGRVTPDAAVALRTGLHPSSYRGPGPGSAFGVGWVDRRPPVASSAVGSLVVMVLPGDALDLDALAAPTFRYGTTPAARTEVNGRPALVLDGTTMYGEAVRSVVTHDETGALVVVVAVGETLPEGVEMVAVASSVRPADESEWERLQIEAFGGPDLTADEGETELARGSAGDVEWLLQTSTQAATATGPIGSEASLSGPPRVQVDECLKVSNRTRSCASPAGGGRGGSVYRWSSETPEFDEVGVPEYVMVTTTLPDVRRMRVTVGDQVVETDVHPVPISGVAAPAVTGAGVAFVELPGEAPLPICSPEPPPVPDGLALVRIDLLDQSGMPIGCAGM